MGLYDTIELVSAVTCPQCRHPIKTTQTKAFDSAFFHYRIGDVIKQNIITVIIRETPYCDQCRKILDDLEFYLLIKYHVLVDTFVGTKEEAWIRLINFEKNDLINLHLDLWSRMSVFRNLYSKLFSEIKSLVDKKFSINAANTNKLSEMIDRFQQQLNTTQSPSKEIDLERECLLSLSEGDLYLRYYDLFRKTRKFHGRFHHLYDAIKKYTDFLQKSEEEKEKLLSEKLDFFNFHWRTLIDLINRSSDPYDIFTSFLNEAEKIETRSFFL